MRDRNKRRLIIYGLIGVLTLTTVAYATLQTVLNISGTVVKKGNLWNIYFTNPSSASVVGSTTGGNLNIQASSLTFSVNLYKPGDKVTYTVDVKNGGTVDATLNSISLTGLDTAKSNNVNYSVTYSDGSSINTGDLLNIGSSKTLKIVVEYDYNATSISSSDINLTFGVTLIYNQTSTGSSSSSGSSGITSNNIIAGIYGNSIQNGTPTPTNPVEIESVGNKTKNLLPIANDSIEITYQNVTLSINNGIITLNGTATSNFQFGFYLENGKLKNTISIIGLEKSNSSLLNLKNGTYTQSFKYISGTKSTDSGSFYLGFYTYKNATKLFDSRDAVNVTDKSKTFTISGNNDIQFFVIQIIAANSSITFNNYKFKYQLEEGSEATEYEPYGYRIPITVSNGTTSKTTNIYLNEPLRKVGEYADYLDLQTGKVTRNIKEIELTDVNKNDTSSNSYLYYKHPNIKAKDQEVISNYFETISNYPSNVIGKISLKSGVIFISGKGIVDKPNSEYSDTSLLNSWLQEKKDNGNPVLVDYVLESPTEETVEVPTIPSLEGNITYEVGTNISPTIEYNY